MSETNELGAWYRADQEAARATYSAADSATLVALLPALEKEIEAGKQALAAWQRNLTDGQDAGAALDAQRSEVADALRARAQSEPGWQQMADEVGATLGAAIDDVRSRSEASEQSLVDVAFVQAVAVTARRQLVREELQRRGLLPAFPH